MRITKRVIKNIIKEYNQKQNRNLALPDYLLRQIKDYVEEVPSYTGDLEDLVIDIYEDLLCECEHEEYDICDDEDDLYNGQGDLIGTNKYQFLVCRICGATAPARTIESDDSYDLEIGEWEK